MNKLVKNPKVDFCVLRHGYLACVIVAYFLVVFASAGISHAQSKDRNNPTRLESSEVSGQINGIAEYEHFYWFSGASQGEVIATLTVETRDAPANSVSFELSNKNEHLVSGSVMAFRERTSQETKHVFLKETSFPILLRISVVGGGSGKYKLTLGGTVYFQSIGEVMKLPSEDTNSKTGRWTELFRAAMEAEELKSKSAANTKPKAKKQSSSSLDGTEWNLRNKVFYIFPSDKQGVVIAVTPWETLNIRMEVITGVETLVGTYKREGNSIRLDFDDYYMIATIKGDIIEGEITYKKPKAGKEKWIVQRVTKGNK